MVESSRVSFRNASLAIVFVVVAAGVSLFESRRVIEMTFAGQSPISFATEQAATVRTRLSTAHSLSSNNHTQNVLQDVRNTIPPTVEIPKSDADWDLIFWSKEPWEFQDSVIIQRKVMKEHNIFLNDMTQVLRVDFRLCNETCPTTLPPNTTLDRLMESWYEYQLNEHSMLEVYLDESSTEKKRVDFQTVVSITVWSSEYKRYVPVYFRNRRKQKSCDRTKGTCPTPCPQNTLPKLPHPYMRDHYDNLCKNSHPEAIPPAREIGGICDCKSTCYTPGAGELNSTWPWQSEAQRKSFLPYWGNSEKKRNHVKDQDKCWFQRRKLENRYQARFTCPIDGEFLPLSCETHASSEYHMFYIPKAKLIFCGIPKVGISEWAKFFRFFHGAGDYLSLPHYKRDLSDFLMTALPRWKAEELMNDPTWTKAVFFRDPYERLLSAYTDKIVGDGYTQKVFGIGTSIESESERPILSFAEFVDLVTNTSTLDSCKDPKGLESCTNPHWRPQMMTCGLDRLLPQFDFIGSLSHSAVHTKLLLEKVGLWDDYGARFDDGRGEASIVGGSGGVDICAVTPPRRGANETIPGFNQRGASKTGQSEHATGSKSRFDELYTPEIKEKVRQAYALDFEVWDEISSPDRSVTDVASGKDLKVVKEYCDNIEMKFAGESPISFATEQAATVRTRLCKTNSLSSSNHTQNVLQDVRNTIPPTVEIPNSDADWDLIFWSKEPWEFQDSVIIQRKVMKEHNIFLNDMTQVLRVDFRLCNETCPTTLPPNTTLDRLMESWYEYQLNEQSMLEVYLDESSTEKKRVDFQTVVSITVWSSEYKRYVPVYFRNRRKQKSCDRTKGTCPTPCPQNTLPKLPHPYMRDHRDKLCKSSHPSAIPPARQVGGNCRCESTCYTPAAVELNSTWPWQSEAQRKSFLPYWGDPDQKSKHVKDQNKCWFQRQKLENRYQARFTCPIDGEFTLSCEAHASSEFHMFYIPKAKLIFCGIPKVGISEWAKFFRFLHGAGDYLSLPHFKEDRLDFLMKAVPLWKAEELMNDPTWTKAVFFRDPYERLLSAYTDKIVGHGYTQKVFGIGTSIESESERPKLSFAEFVDLVTNTSTLDNCDDPKGLTSCTDPHWRPQMMTCGLDRLLPQFDFVGSLSHSAVHTKLLLEKVGVWDDYGAKFDDGRDQASIIGGRGGGVCAVRPPMRGANETIPGFNQRGASKTGQMEHVTGSKSRFDELYTPEIKEKVRHAYALDFAVWDEISSPDRAVTDVASGKDLKVVKEYCDNTSTS